MQFFLNTLVLFRRDIRKKKRIFYPGTDSFKTRNLDKPSIDYIIQIYVADANGMTRFGLFGSRFLISFPPAQNVHIRVLILDILELWRVIRVNIVMQFLLLCSSELYSVSCRIMF